MVSRRFLVTVFVVMMFTSAVVGVFYLMTKQFLFEGADTAQREVIFAVPVGIPFPQVAHQLEDLGLLKNAEAFILYARWTRAIPKVKAGEYRFHTSMTPVQIMRVLTSGVSVRRALTIPEGYSSFEIAELLEKKGFAKKNEILKLVFDPDFAQKLIGQKVSSLEGYLFPNSYQFTRSAKPEQILEAFVSEFKKNFSEIQGPYPFEWNAHQVVTLASIIEKETGAPFERPLISSVFHNRIKKKMRLQTDPTIIYAKALQSGKIMIDIRKSDLKLDHPYNTYMKSGLPPGPIANPGLGALLAAIQPETSEYLFFVSQNDGTHIFSENYQNHAKAVQQYQMNRKARAGKSWRDLTKEK
jgi:UPF0755 protein